MQDICGVAAPINLVRNCVLTRYIDRCALTFLAIQEPGISKICDTCGREYLDEDTALERDAINSAIFISRADQSDKAANESAMASQTPTDPVITEDQSLAHALFKAHDVCIFCGGKFVG